ncbi:MAG: signal peptidase I [Deltaproteobacteria bacterium]|nr:signal peptidase I [Deltaproteobacteria bacterium]
MKAEQRKQKSALREYIEAILIAVGIAVVLRIFFFEPFKIPTGSMIPTIEIGDHIFVNKIIYGIRLPLINKQVVHFSDPKRGQIFVFIYPEDKSKNFIKRLIGLPGDKIEIKNDLLYINDVPVQRKQVEGHPVLESFSPLGEYEMYEETLDEAAYHVLYLKDEPNFDNFGPIIVPKDHFFAMGDNRDHSRDSRIWGFVPRDNIKGKALFVWLSLNRENRYPIIPLPKVRWERFGRKLK